MKKMIFLVLLTMSFTSFAAQIKIIKKDLQLKVAEVEVKTTCVEIADLDPDTDVTYDCKIGTIRSNLQKKFKNISKIQSMNNDANYVMTNQVDDEGSYKVKLRILYY